MLEVERAEIRALIPHAGNSVVQDVLTRLLVAIEEIDDREPKPVALPPIVVEPEPRERCHIRDLVVSDPFDDVEPDSLLVKPKPDAWREVREKWNAMAKEVGLSPIMRVTKARQTAYLARQAEYCDVSKGETLIDLLVNSLALPLTDFALGKEQDKDWKISFTYCLKPDGCAKVVEGGWLKEEKEYKPTKGSGLAAAADWLAMKEGENGTERVRQGDAQTDRLIPELTQEPGGNGSVLDGVPGPAF